MSETDELQSCSPTLDQEGAETIQHHQYYPAPADGLSAVRIDILRELGDHQTAKHGPRSLREFCLKACFLNTPRITDIGDVPYRLIKAVLRRMGPTQLLVVERNSPHIVPQSNEIWDELLTSSFSSAELQAIDNSRVKDSDVRKKYFRLLESRKRRLKQTSAKIKAEYDRIAEKKQKIVSLDVHADPENKRKRKTTQLPSSPAALKRMSIVKRARIETLSNQVTPTNHNLHTKSMPEVYPISHEEAERRRERKLLERMKGKHGNVASSSRDDEARIKSEDVDLHVKAECSETTLQPAPLTGKCQSRGPVPGKELKGDKTRFNNPKPAVGSPFIPKARKGSFQ
ncbi:RNA polymerase II transcription factor SIII subunit A-domain-containing protein [Myxozyma melibiosi]|uniref:Elongin-A n=1 Tax=Myxozyma melibiosi TaxID=54550 RepID=A0ABR1F122_9ASCO